MGMVHVPCTLVNDEILLARDNISQSEALLSSVEEYPERWLRTGEPYEFTTRPTTPPPSGLVEAFSRLAADVGILGLYYIDHHDQDKIIEYIEGRKNISRPFNDATKIW
ncbi:MAG: hypothetical protein L6R38_006735 [Xanthoria sp. 2 TBL-2021]|nr:MAG: hypothetical protein LQ349_008108 [Xanthoria aureola]KAI4271950.1 MAG: hypothetical protein L6R38_006735 [Xanthoria sp. 2 TBL-2021]